jgi:hypothetical protein
VGKQKKNECIPTDIKDHAPLCGDAFIGVFFQSIDGDF